MLAGQDMVRPGQDKTFKDAKAVGPAPVWLVVIGPVVLFFTPALVPVTVTLNWHFPTAGTVAPASEITVGAVVVSVPPQTDAEELLTVNPAGKVSVKLTPVKAIWLGLSIVKVNDVVLLGII